MISSTARILSSISIVGGRSLRDAFMKSRVGSLNSATHFAAVQYDRAQSSSRSANSLAISVALNPFRVENLMTARYSVFDVLTNNPYKSAIFLT